MLLTSLLQTLGGGDGGLSGFAILGDRSSGAEGEVSQNKCVTHGGILFFLFG